MFAYVFIALTFVSFTASADDDDDDILNVDRSVSKSIQLAFSNDKNITPKKSDFEVVNYVLMSNENGERWGVLTLTNLSHGERSINQEHYSLCLLMAVALHHWLLRATLKVKKRNLSPYLLARTSSPF